MSEQEVYDTIKKLRNKIIHTKSKKLKRLYMLDIMSLQQYLLFSYGIMIDDREIYHPRVYEQSQDLINNYADTEINEYMSINDLTKSLSNGCLNVYSNLNYNYITPDIFAMYTDDLNKITYDFVSKLDDDAMKTYKEVAESVLSIDMTKFGGICWNLYGINKQVINLSSFYYDSDENISDVDLYRVFAHELGHAVHLNKFNKLGKNTYYNGVFSEAHSLLYEKMFVNFLEENNIDTKDILIETRNLFLTQTIAARAGALAVEKDDIKKDELIPNEYFSNHYFDKYLDISTLFLDQSYTETLPYFYGDLIATKILDEFGNDYKNASKQLLDIMIKTDNLSSKDKLKEIGLDKVPKGLARTLRKINK